MSISKADAAALQARVKSKSLLLNILKEETATSLVNPHDIYVILGTCPSKSNSYRIGHKVLFKTEALREYEDSFEEQFKAKSPTIDGDFEFNIDVYYPNNRSDLDGCFKVVLDLLQKTKAIKNDRYCMKITARKFIDKQRPRVEFQIIAL